MSYTFGVLLVCWIVCIWGFKESQIPSWGKCPFKSTRPDVVCSNVSVPLNWDDPKSTNIYVFVAKIPATTLTENGTVWFLNGGSGVGAQCFAGNPPPWVEYMNSLGISFVAPDFRGAGLSTPSLSCPDDPDNQQIPSIACAKYYDTTFGSNGMYNFSMTQAAKDLGYLITHLSSEAPNYIEGDSFGTAWGQRYLQIFPTQSDGAVIESFLVFDVYDYFRVLINVDSVGKTLMGYCNNDIFCNSWAGNSTDPTIKLFELMQLASNRTLPCIQRLPSKMAPDGDWHGTFQSMFGVFLGESRDTYALAPSLIFRLFRCSEDDVKAIVHLWEYQNGQQLFVSQSKQPDPCGISQVILYNFFMSEGVQNVPNFQYIREEYQNQLFGGPLSILQHSVELWENWPRYKPDQYFHQNPIIQRPVLFFNGNFDTATPWPNAAYASKIYAKSLVLLPTVPHVGLLNSPVSYSRLPCGLEMAIHFFLSGGSNINTTCVDYILPLDFRGKETVTQTFSELLYGTPDPWGLDKKTYF